MEKETQIISARKQLKQFGKFLEHHSTKLNDILNKENFHNLSNITISNLDSIQLKQIKINYSENKENLSIFKLIDSDNKIFNKIIITFLYLNLEGKKILKNSEILQEKFLFLDEDLCAAKFPLNTNNDIDDYLDFGQQQNIGINIKTGASDVTAARNDNLLFNFNNTEDCLIKISECMEFLCQIQFCINALLEISSIILQQLTVFHSYDKKSWDFHYNFKFEEIFITLENLMIELIIYDEILAKSNFNKFWPSYKKTLIQSFHQNSKQFKAFDCNENEIIGMINILNELEILFDGNIFQTFLDSTYRTKERLIQNPKGLNQLSTTFLEYIKENLQNLKKFPIDLCEFNETRKLIGLNSFVLLHHQFFGQIDQKLFKQLIDLNYKYAGIVLVADVIWCPEIFISKHAETLMVGGGGVEKYFQESIKSRQTALQSKISLLTKNTRNYAIEISMWILKVKSAVKQGSNNLKIEQFRNLCIQFLQGIHYIGQMSHTIKSILNLHKLMKLPVDLEVLNNISKLIEMLKTVKCIFSSDYENIAKIIIYCKQCLQYKCLHLIISTKKKFATHETLKPEIVDVISALKILEKAFNGPPTTSRLFIMQFLIQSQTLQKQIQQEDYEKLKKNVKRLKAMMELQDNLEIVSSTTFFYWHQYVMEPYLNQIIDKNFDIYNFQHILKVFDDCSENLDKLSLQLARPNLILKRNNYNQLRREIISKLCGKIETFLRLEVHKQLDLHNTNPFEQQEFGNDNRLLINNVLILNGNYVSLKFHVENYLSNMFYNLTTIYLHDWKTYEEMRQLAHFKHHLVPIDDYLPTQTLEQGIDALEIMRNIHVFVTKYNYNMNNQYFVENSSNNRYLNTIGINHVANSLKTHGSGIINTTVNFSYQFLRQKFYTFSQFLYDEQINSRLLKENRYVWEAKKKMERNESGVIKTNSDKFIFEYDRADDFNKEIRKLGFSNDGLSYMDLFRQLITQVGNTMGYIRMMRSGNVHANYTASIHLPNFSDDLNFVKLCEAQNLSNVTKESAELLEINIRDYYRNFSEEDMDFFKILVNAFKPFFQNPNNIHLKNFYLIVPSLMLNYVEYILNAREKITKREKYASCLFDDGFAMGLAYILKLSNQFSEFETLHWFTSIERKFQLESNDIRAEMSKNNDESLLQTLILVEKRVKSKFREYSLLRDSLYSAKIFFH